MLAERRAAVVGREEAIAVPRGACLSGLCTAADVAPSGLEARALDVVAEVGPHILGHGRLEDVGVHRPERGFGLVAHAGRERLDDPLLEARSRMGAQDGLALLRRELVE